MTRDGTPWFIASDVCKALGLGTNNGSYGHHLRRLNADQFTSTSDLEVKLPGTGMAQAKLVSEGGLYALVLRSDKPEARAFQAWVTDTVRPALRKDGMYVVREEKVATDEPPSSPTDGHGVSRSLLLTLTVPPRSMDPRSRLTA